MAPHPSIPGHVYAGTASGVIWNVDGGTHWRTISTGTARAIAFDLNIGRIYFATDAGILTESPATAPVSCSPRPPPG